MLKYIAKRLFLTIVTIAVVFTVTFFILRMIDKTPDAIQAEIQKRVTNNKAKTPLADIVQQVHNKYDYHPDWNAFVAFGHYLKNLFRDGDFGVYFARPEKSIPTHFAEPLKYTFTVSGLGFLFGTSFGFLFGIIAGYKRGKIPDVLLNAFSILFVAIPSFVLAAVVVIIANNTNWPTQFMSIDQAGGFWPMFKTLIIPIALVTVTSFATITYYIRNEVVEVLKSDYIATARAKGLSESQVFFGHVLRNIMIPAVGIILSRFIYIILGSLIIEIFFNVPGAAKMINLAITTTEINVVMFTIVFFSSLGLVLEIVIDTLYTVLDPRIRFAEKSSRSIVARIKHWTARKRAVRTNQVEGGARHG